MEALECSICCEGLNDSSRRPRFLPCGHTICTICVDKSIKGGDKTCPNCRKPHYATAASKLPIVYALEEVFRKLSEKSSNKSAVIGDDCKKETVISDDYIDPKVLIHSINTAISESQNRMKVTESKIENHQAHLSQKSAEMERLMKDIQEENKAKKVIKSSITQLEDERKYLENSVHKITETSTHPVRLYPNLDEDIKSDLKSSSMCQDDERVKSKKISRSQTNEESNISRTEQNSKAEGFKTKKDSLQSCKAKMTKEEGSKTRKDSTPSLIKDKFEAEGLPLSLILIEEKFVAKGWKSNENSFKSRQVDTVKVVGSQSNEDSPQSSKEFLLDSLQSRKVVLAKAEGVLGIDIVFGIKPDSIYISTIYKGSAAHKNGGLKIGDRLLTINGEIITSYSKTVYQIEKATGIVVLEVRYIPSEFLQLFENPPYGRGIKLVPAEGNFGFQPKNLL